MSVGYINHHICNFTLPGEGELIPMPYNLIEVRARFSPKC